MARVTLPEIQAWSEKTRLEVTDSALTDSLLGQIETQVLAALANTGYDASTWVDQTTTPQLVRSIISMLYIAALYDRSFSEDAGDSNPYAIQLREMAASNITGLLTGILTLEDATVAASAGGDPIFYPNDESSAADPRWGECVGDTSAGPAKFSMGTVF